MKVTGMLKLRLRKSNRRHKWGIEFDRMWYIEDHILYYMERMTHLRQQPKTLMHIECILWLKYNLHNLLLYTTDILLEWS